VQNDPKKLVGMRIRELRLAKGVSQEALADQAGLHRTYMGSVERGERNISLENIVRIAHALRVQPSILLETLR
jgi:transcriptional regulator with XRE-family HTH domain